MVTEVKCWRGRRRVSGLRGWMRTGKGEGTAEKQQLYKSGD